MLDVKRLRVLREVAAQGSFSAAAEALAYTQSAVSQQIAALEREAGTVLVERNARGVRLTEAGRALVAPRRRHPRAARRRRGRARRDRRHARRAPAARLVPDRGRDDRPARDRRASASAIPGVEVTLAPREPDEGLDCLKAGECDIALTVEAGFDRDHRQGDRAPPAARRPDVPLPAGLPSASRARRGCASRTSPTSRGSWARPARCPDGAILAARLPGAPASSRASPSSPTTTTRSRASSRPASASASSPTSRSSPCATTSSSASSRAAPPVRHILAATLAGGFVSPAAAAMLEILVEVGAEFQATNRSLALAS